MEITAAIEGLRIFSRSIKAKLKGIRKYKGNAGEICGQIVNDCWNGKYFQASTRNYPIFYTRDFSFCTEALLKLGYKEEVGKTLNYAMECFKKNNVAAAISKSKKPFDFPFYAADSLPLFLRSIRISKNRDLVGENPDFFSKQAEMFFNLTIGRETGLVRKDKCFSSIRDYSVRKSSCYDNVMAALLSSELKKMKVHNPLSGFNYTKIIKENFWNGGYFRNDLESDYVCADANLFPFWAGIFNNKKMMKSAFEAMQDEKLDVPFPLKYSKKGIKQKMIWQEVFVPSWERNMAWGHLGMIYIGLLKKLGREKAEFHIQQYTKQIERYGSFLELFDESRKPYSSMFYYSDEGMLWAAMFPGSFWK